MFKQQQFFSSPSILIIARVFTAAVLGYVLSMVICLWMTSVTGLSGNESKTLNSLVFFIIYLSVILTVFSINCHRKAILGTGALTAVLSLSWVLIGGQA